MKKRSSASPRAKRGRPVATLGSISATVAVVTAKPLASEPFTVNLQPVRFGYFNPDAKEVFLVGSFNNWETRATPLVRDSLGDWAVELELPPGKYRYRLLVDGEWRDHPSAQQTAPNPFGAFDAVVVV
jgi:1,4-alpha-glucan branching enzyme